MKKPPLTFVLAAGGTGGHMYPAEALKNELLERGYKVILFSDARGLSYPDLFEGIETFEIESGTFTGGKVFSSFKTAYQLIRGTLKSTFLLFRISPAGVVGFGGYPVFPTMAAARFLTIPYCLHEQNAVLGRANRALAKKARAIALSFAQTRRVKKRWRKKVRVTGNPVRPAIIELGKNPYPALKKDYVIRLLVFGGSQGAKIFSDVVPGALSLLPKALRSRLQVTQQCRKEDCERVKQTYRESGIAAEVFPYIRDIPERLLWSHLVISRAGATSIFELTAAGRPAILVPMASALHDHQGENAKNLEKTGAAWVMTEKEFTPAALAKQVQKLALNPGLLKKAAAAALALGHPQAARELADLVEDMALSKPTRTRQRKKARKKDRTGKKLKRVAA